MEIRSCLYVKAVKGKGNGVFTKEPIPANTTVEISPVVVLSKKESDIADDTILRDYTFLWGPKQVKGCIALGYCSVYNHSYTPNCENEMDFDENTMSVMTLRDIKAGEELCINYNGDEMDEDEPLWFKVK